MKVHNFGYDINHIIAHSNRLHLYQVEGYALQLDDFLTNSDGMTPEVENLINKTVDFLYGLLLDEEEEAHE